MSDLTTELSQLFQQYLTCWNARDLTGVAECFSEPAMFVLPNAAVPVPNRATLILLLEKIFVGLDADNFSHTTIGQISASQSGPLLAVVEARDVTRIRTDNSIIETIDGHYIAQLVDGEWRFTVAVSCQQGWRNGQ